MGVVDELAAYPGGWVALARLRYGCRVEERLLEYCPEEMTSSLMMAVALEAHTLSRDAFGNYVVQHVLEYGAVRYRSQVASALIQDGIVALAQHRIASNVVQKAF